jgi:hypothetical protein
VPSNVARAAREELLQRGVLVWGSERRVYVPGGRLAEPPSPDALAVILAARLCTDGTWEAGDALPRSSALTEELGVPRASVRHAFRVLARIALVAPPPGAGSPVVAGAPTERLDQATAAVIAGHPGELDPRLARIYGLVALLKGTAAQPKDVSIVFALWGWHIDPDLPPSTDVAPVRHDVLTAIRTAARRDL